ncbi:hypothetical protein KY305_06535 [Bacillus sp. YC2]|nr:hypothetical protein [Bacillus sp. YC2]
MVFLHVESNQYIVWLKFQKGCRGFLDSLKIAPPGNLLPVEKVAETAQKALKTGEPGDGKIFIYEIHNKINIRTGEEGPDTL